MTSDQLHLIPVWRVDWPHHVTSTYADMFWLPVLGPSSIALLRLIARQPNMTPLTPTRPKLAEMLGLGGGAGAVRNIERTIRRLQDNGLAKQHSASIIELSVVLPTLRRRQIDALDLRTQTAHAQILTNQRQK